MSKKVLFFTGSRADYGLIKPVMLAIKKYKNIDPLLVVAGSHLSEIHGKTIECIKKDGFKIDAKVDTNPMVDSCVSMANSVGNGIFNMTAILIRLKPDYVFLVGDRSEALAMAIAAGYMNIPIMHHHGGDVSGNIDDAARNSITHFSKIHFAATDNAAERIRSMCGKSADVHVTGSTALDDIRKHKKKKLKLFSNNDKTFLIIQHPVTKQFKSAGYQMRTTLSAVSKKGNMIIIYPNNDAGNTAIISEIEKYRSKPGVYICKNVDRKTYIDFLANCDAMVGNSSSGIIEAALLKKPVINIGVRQKGRHYSDNVITVGHNEDDIIKAINYMLTLSFSGIKSLYGDGNASEKIAKIMSEVV